MPEPACACCLGITLTWVPEPTVDITLLADNSLREVVGHGPVCLAGITRLVTDPTCFTTDTPHNTVRSNAVYTGTQVWYIIVDFGVNVAVAAFATVVSVTTTCTVEPHLELVRTILGQLLALFQEYLSYICILAIMSRVTVPWRDVEAVLHVMFAACIGKKLGDVCVASVIITGILDAVRCCSCWPQAETIVVLYNGNTAIHTGSLHCSNPLFGVRHSQRSIS